MESQPQNPEFRNNPENFHPGKSFYKINFPWTLMHFHVYKNLFIV